MAVWTLINWSFESDVFESRRLDPGVALTSWMMTWLALTPAAADTAVMKAPLTGLFGLLKLETVVLSVMTAVMILVYEHTKPFSHLQCRREELPSADTVCKGHTLMLVELGQ